MTEADFHEKLDDLFDRLEMALETAADTADEDIDCDLANGVLTITLANGSSIILSRQPATRQLWLAAKAGGFHFTLDEAADAWICTRSGASFTQLFGGSLQDQAKLNLPANW
ncbi:MAG: CyaY protein [Halieaceae bacterium]|jgi:CyaY protein